MFLLIGTAFDDMDTYHDSVEEKQNKTLRNLEEIQEAIAFMSDVCQKLFNISIDIEDDLISKFNQVNHWIYLHLCFECNLILFTAHREDDVYL